MTNVRALGSGDDGGTTRARAAVTLSGPGVRRSSARGARLATLRSRSGRVAQRESARLTRERSQVQNLPRPPIRRSVAPPTA